jgi:hypothetical protein
MSIQEANNQLGGEKKGFSNPAYHTGMACRVTKLEIKPTAIEIPIPTAMEIK